jgi:hypothetical protein
MPPRKVPFEMMEIAKENNISRITVYKRLETGKYTIQEAVTKPVKGSKNCFKSDSSEHYKRKKSKGIMIYYYDNDYDRLRKYLADTNTSLSKFVCEAIETHLNNSINKTNEQ